MDLLRAASLKVKLPQAAQVECSFADSTPDGDQLQLMLDTATAWMKRDEATMTSKFILYNNKGYAEPLSVVLGAQWSSRFQQPEEAEKLLFTAFSRSMTPEERLSCPLLVCDEIAATLPSLNSSDRETLRGFLRKLDERFYVFISRSLAVNALNLAHTTKLTWPRQINTDVCGFLNGKKPRHVASLLDGAIRSMPAHARAPFFALVVLNYGKEHAVRARAVSVYDGIHGKSWPLEKLSPRFHQVPYLSAIKIYHTIEEFLGIFRARYCLDEDGTAAIVPQLVKNKQDKKPLREASCASGSKIREELITAIPGVEDIMHRLIRNPRVPCKLWDEYLLLRCQKKAPLTSPHLIKNQRCTVIQLRGGQMTIEASKRKIEGIALLEDAEQQNPLEGLTLAPEPKRRK
jgi:hypothetical protein